jgi:hypothetical protein
MLISSKIIHIAYALVSLLMLSVAIRSLNKIISESPLNYCDFGCGLVLNTTVLPATVAAFISMVLWVIWAKGKVSSKYILSVVSLTAVLWAVLVGYARINL